MTTIIRLAKQKDIPALERLLRQIAELHHKSRPDIFISGGQKYTTEALEKMLTYEDFPIFVAADENDEVQGYCFCQVRNINHPVIRNYLSLFIDDFCVDETLRGQGIGKKLFAAAKEYAKECGAYNIELNVWAVNEGAVKFYEDFGFNPKTIGMELIL